MKPELNKFTITFLFLLLLLVLSLLTNVYLSHQTQSLHEEVLELKSENMDQQNRIESLKQNLSNQSREITQLEDELIKQRRNGTYLSERILNYLELRGESCNVNETNFRKVGGCIENLVSDIQSVPEFSSGGFVNYGPPARPTGKLILNNKNERSLNPDSFTLYLNNEIADNDGCNRDDEVPPGSTCTLEFFTTCHRGDILEVSYEGETTYSETC